nr:ribosome assembly protein 1 [Quercus suber]
MLGRARRMLIMKVQAKFDNGVAEACYLGSRFVQQEKSDVRPDEQLRGITMESSAISLYFSLLRRSAPDVEPTQKEYLINLIDSPGHIDFSSEVSTASRLCDGAVVLVDAVEGVCSQTVTVLRQTWIEKLRPLLVINKMDRLITEWKLTPGEAYTHLSKLLEQVNAVMGSFALGERMEDDLRWRERIDEKVSAAAAAKEDQESGSSRGANAAHDGEDVATINTAEYEDKEDEDIYFAPEKNNVIFSSAIDGWAFTPRQFAGLYAKKLGIKHSILEKVLWGDFYLDPKTKRILGAKHLKGRHLKPMFVHLVLEQIWAVYEATMGGPNNKGDPALLEKITKGLSLNIPSHILRSRDPKALLSAVFSAWLPLSTALLVSVIEGLPSPPKAQEARMPTLLEASPGADHISASITDAIVHSRATIGEPVVAYVSKMISIPVCSQTVTVLRQTWIEKLRPLLVINKMDRLITEWKLTPGEAYTHLSKLLEQVNAVMGSFALGERMEDDLRWRERIDEKVSAAAAAKEDQESGSSRGANAAHDGEDVATINTAEYEDKEDEDIYFAPEKNNVIFSSAIDGWAFTPRQFAGLYAKKLGIKHSILEKVLWGDFYLDPKTKRILGAKHLKGRHLKPMFVHLVLEQIWAVYEATMGGPNNKGDPALLEKITKGLSLNIPSHILRSRDPKALLSAVFSAWLPLSTALLVSVIEGLPSPPKAQEARMPTLLEASPGADHISASITDAIVHSRATIGEPVVAYVSKMISIPESELPVNKRKGGILSAEEARELGRKKRAEIARVQAQASSDTDVTSVTDALSAAAIGDEDEVDVKDDGADEKEDPEHLIGFGRIFSGTLSVGDELYVLPPKFTPANPAVQPQPKKVVISALYLLMGRSLESLNSVPAGSIVGIAGLEGAILKSGTICSQVEGAPNLSSTTAISTNAPIVRVALEPAYPGDLDKMIRGLRLLEQADPAVIYEQLESGEHVILTAGELHLERCLKDLRERFAKCDVQAGEAIVPYREGIVRAEEMNPPKDPALGRGRVESTTSSKQIVMRIVVRPLPAPVTEFLVRHSGAVKRLYSERKAQEEERKTNGPISDVNGNGPTDDIDAGHEIVEEDAGVEGGHVLSLTDFKQKLSAAFAEEKIDREIWRDAVEKISAFGPRRPRPSLHETPDTVEDQSASIQDKTLSPLVSKVLDAFQLATAQGPLCNEPTQGVAVFLESLALTTTPSESSTSQNLGRLTGEILSTTRASIRAGFLDWSPRLLLAMYSCEIQASADVLGRVYSVITRRRGRIVSENLLSTTSTFTILALLPIPRIPRPDHHPIRVLDLPEPRPPHG